MELYCVSVMLSLCTFVSHTSSAPPSPFPHKVHARGQAQSTSTFQQRGRVVVRPVTARRTTRGAAPSSGTS